MPYEFINQNCAEIDFEAALKNFNNAEWDLKTRKLIWEVNGMTPAELLSCLRVYQLCRDRVIDIGKHVNRSFGRPTPPELPDWCPHPDTLAAP
ncbi:hypothetical protein [Prescottella agglutinans]|uniref:Uncharacterized protein YutE (UPF0331/DUF86 family) n=1 Tax=Prescottella agglutinans TaxID=1644129 RepID=A0ABT6MFM9_9NOCA|nr:hypothetical protein [Prescottella agglutinans]MDH6283126.1 uncharacterized protein YutE (UPF0331/DUF86 family) [Prescottella agglutinans]